MSENLYKAPDAVVRDVGEYDTFGGWLRFFQFLQAFIILSIAGAFLYVGWTIVSWSQEYDEPLVDLIGVPVVVSFVVLLTQAAAVMVVMTLILRIITKREEWVPKAVIRYLKILFLVSLIGFVLGYYLYSRGLVTEKPASLFSDILYYFIWSSYFKKSKRVNGYYRPSAGGGVG